MRKIVLILLLLSVKSGYCQLAENFSDGDFNAGPIWNESKAGDFVIINGMLRSNSAAVNSNFYITTENSLALSVQWEFWCNLKFNTSGANYVDIYLVSNQQDLKSSAINGYFIRIGNTDDDVCLYRRSGSLAGAVKIIDGPNGITNTSNNQLRIKVTRDAQGLFELSYDKGGTGQAFMSAGTATDLHHVNSSYFGLSIQQSTASFVQRHYFDDFSILPLVTDTEAPKLTSIVVQDATHIDVTFNEPVEAASAMIANNYALNNGYGIPVNVEQISAAGYRLGYATPLTTNNFLLNINNIKDLKGNIIAPITEGNFFYIEPYTAKSGEVVINEIFADPSPSVGLPGAEFVEIWNTTNRYIFLKDWKFKDETSTYTFKNDTIKPLEHILLTAAADKDRYAAYGKTIGLSPWPGLGNEKDVLTLLNADSTIIDKVAYQANWYKDEIKKGGGYTLELIDPASNCKGIQNWMASIAPQGGTPGAQNSTFNAPGNGIQPKLSFVSIADDHTLRLTFSSPVDSSSASIAANYSVNNNIGTPLAATPDGPGFTSVLLTFHSAFPDGILCSLSVSGIKNCAKNVIDPGSTLTFLYIAPSIAKAGEVVINEIFADPSPSVGLPGAEFVELWNTTNRYILLKDWKFKDETSTYTFKNDTIKPLEHILLTAAADKDRYAVYGKTIGLSPWPGLGNEKDVLTLLSADSTIIDKVAYQDSWYKDEIKKGGGYTLELINPASNCKGIQNWMASIAPEGGTPAKQNAVYNYLADNSRPALKNVTVVDSITLRLSFSKPINSAVAAVTTLYTINNGVGHPVTAVPEEPDFSSVLLTLPEGLARGVECMLTITGISDCGGNTIDLSRNSGRVFLPKKIIKGDLLINEVLFNPKTGSVDFVEIYNASDHEINLRNLQLANADASGNPYTLRLLSDTDFIIQSNAYLVLTSNPESVRENYFTLAPENFLKMSTPAFPVAKGTVFILNKGLVIDRFDYHEGLHIPLLKQAKGVSLERVSLLEDANAPGNFTSASATAGYATPAFKNSVAVEGVTTGNPFKLTAKVFSPDGDGIDETLTICYNFSRPGTMGSIDIYNDKGILQRNLIRNHNLSTAGVLVWDGKDGNGKICKIGIYVLRFEVFNLQGRRKTYTQTCVLAAKLN